MLNLTTKEHDLLLKRGERIDESDLIKAPACDGTREERLQSLLRWQRQVAKTVLSEEEEEPIHYVLYK